MKNFSTLLLVLVVIGFAFNTYRQYQQKKVLTRYIEDFKTLQIKETFKYSILGSEYDITKNKIISQKNTSNIRNAKYAVCIIITKINCPQCISKYIYALEGMSLKNVSAVLVSNDLDQLNQTVKQYDAQITAMHDTTDRLHEITKNNGPVVVIIDLRNNMIINVFDQLYIIEDNDEHYVEFIRQING